MKRLVCYPLLLITLISLSYQEVCAQNGVTELYSTITQLDADYGSLSRFYWINSSPERRERFTSLFKEYQGRLNQMNFDELSQGGKIDYLLTKRYLDNKLHELSSEKEQYEAITDWVSFADPLYEIEQMRRRGKHLDSKRVAKTLDDVNSSLELKITNIKSKVQSKSKSLKKLAPLEYKRALDVVKGQVRLLGDVYNFYDGFDPQFSWWIEKPKERLVANLNEYKKVLASCIDSTMYPEDDGSGIYGQPIGLAEFKRQLKSEYIPYSPEQLLEIAEKEFEWCDQEVLKVSKEMGFGKDWKAALEKVKRKKQLRIS